VFWPSASTLIIVINEAAGAGHGIWIAIYAVVKFVTDFWIFVGEITVFTGTLDSSLGGLKFSPISTIDGEWKVTTFMIRVFNFKQESIGAKFSFSFVVNTLVIFVALFRVREKSVVFWALECGCESDQSE